MAKKRLHTLKVYNAFFDGKISSRNVSFFKRNQINGCICSSRVRNIFLYIKKSLTIMHVLCKFKEKIAYFVSLRRFLRYYIFTYSIAYPIETLRVESGKNRARYWEQIVKRIIHNLYVNRRHFSMCCVSFVSKLKKN